MKPGADRFPLLTPASRVRDVWAHPLGRDVLSKILMQAGLPRAVVTNPVASRVRLRTFARLGHRFGVGEEFVTALVALLNTHRDLPPNAAADRAKGHAEPWWRSAVFYQVYPRSFADSDGDGIGDIPGIISRLDYLQDLGVDALWLSPVYDSPNDDNGYDIRDYRAISPEFGTMADMDRLIAELHARGMRLIMDLVINHTSDEHPWFQAALADPDSPYRDYYFFRPGRANPADPVIDNADPGIDNGSVLPAPAENQPRTILDAGEAGDAGVGGDAGGSGGAVPPNNWTSFFSGPAWRHFPARAANPTGAGDPTSAGGPTGEWALHLFSAKQMDLNWGHPPLREELYEMVRWWLEKGVDGFRLDVINYISKPDSLPDGNEFIGELMEFTGIEHYFAGPRLHEHLRELRAEAFTAVTVAIGETPGVGTQLAKLLTHPDRRELDMVFTFDHLETPGHTRFDDYRYDLTFLRDHLTEYISDYGATCWPALFFENHDNPRMISKVDPRPEFRRALGRLLALIQLTLPGTPFIYQGQELGAINEPFTGIEDLRDVESLNRYADLLAAGHPQQAAFAQVLAGTRDHARTPVAWTSDGGFTAGDPWLPSPATGERPNVADSLTDPHSVLNAYRDLIALRRSHRALTRGTVRFGPKAPGRWRYVRMDDDGAPAFRIELNLTDTPRRFTEPGPGWEVVFTTSGELAHDPGARSILAPYDGRLYRRAI